MKYNYTGRSNEPQDFSWMNEFVPGPHSVEQIWYEEEFVLWRNFVEDRHELQWDAAAKFLFHEGFFNLSNTPAERQIYQSELTLFLRDNYGYDFKHGMDWEAWANWYKGQKEKMEYETHQF